MSDEPPEQPPDEPAVLPRSPSELDATIIHQAIFEGSSAAFVLLYRHYEGGVRYAIARAAIRAGVSRREDVEDLIQGVWCRLLDNDRRILRYYDASRGKLGPFLRWVAYQLAQDLARRQHRKSFPIDGPPPNDGPVDERALRFVIELVQSDLVRKLIAKVDAQLTDVDRRVLREHYLGERTLRDLAKELGLTENALAQRNKRLKNQLQRLAKALLQSPDPPSAPPPPPPSVVMCILIAWLCDFGAQGQTMASYDSPTAVHGAGPLNPSTH
ncbi:RNA polymerase sigma factor [Paraliomyxa miuraensis]|uniref:RNA polymerase sigma factor n=1 Tax=Paraliomyxa miuraensis TaxID=376150 RepID=UPI00224CACC9|nr:sigma-70 family RNA polymerase sigma factor [Paraliomyxa miuraensis]MCX4239188.1 sigma-70 family RNA polymerase sigma factor [Paraliomyxa miuraensis]